MADYWNSHSLDEDWDEGHDASFELRAQRSRRVIPSPEVFARLAKEAQLRGIATETLVNLWLTERLQRSADVADAP